LGGGGVDGAIHRAGGKAILDECKKIVEKQGGCKPGEAVITTAGELPAKYVIHTVGPVWNGGNNQESQKLADCYLNSLKLGAYYDCSKVAFPGISTGVYRFPKNLAARIAVYAVNKFLLHSHKIEKVLFVCFDDEYYNLINEEMKFLRRRSDGDYEHGSV
jgi:O-acetyl-ADP-ribose deacetylase (regulator of RNase III)